MTRSVDTPSRGLLGVPNVGLHVSDADRSLAFYVDLLGFEVVRDSGWIDDELVLAMTATPLPAEFHTPGAMHLALDPDGFFVQLLQRPTPEPT